MAQDVQIAVELHVCLADPKLRKSWSELFKSAEFIRMLRSIEPLSQLTVTESATLIEAEARLKELFQSHRDVGAILLSDNLIDSHESWRPEWRQESALKELADEFAHDPYVSVAVAVDVERIPDVDWVLPQTCDEATLHEALEILVRRLCYFVKPARQPDRPIPQVTVRPLLTQWEMLSALKLRYQVYRVMGYLDDAFLRTKVAVELNWCDRISRHFGLFLQSPEGSERLIGTTRLVLTKLPDLEIGTWYEAIAQSHTALQPLLNRQRQEIAQFRLPALQTLKLNDDLRAEALSNAPWGEISRVIVPLEWRGCHFADRLVEAAVEAAKKLKVQELFLECLEMHSCMYQKCGFEVIGQRGEVLGVGKTMLGMRLRKSDGTVSPTTQES